MAISENGFTVVESNSPHLVTINVGNSAFKIKRFSEKAFSWLLGELNQIEDVDEAGWDGGYAHRPIAGSTRWSNHASGTAIDWNASQHGRGQKQFEGWSEHQVKQIRELLATKQGKVFRWGADYVHSKKDPMHFELIEKDHYHELARIAGFE
jgi:hypothetical protein